jgi:protocatechuate 3,4-dioxygenase beta subunit
MATNCWIFVLLALSAAAQTVPDQKAPATLEGRVIHSATSEAVRKARVTLESTAEQHDSALVATTDDAGYFQFANVAPGVYRLTAAKNGFLEGGYGRTKPQSGLTRLKVSAGDRLQDLTLRLFPGGAISGRVLDADGDPVAGQEVMIWEKRLVPGDPAVSHGGDATTNEAGEYRVDGLFEGTYYVRADPEMLWEQNVRQIPVDSTGHVTKLHELPTFFPAAVSISDAQPIHIESGQEQSGIDIRIQRGVTPSVKGRIAGITGSASRYELSAAVTSGFGWTPERGKILPNGDFSFEALPPGKHTLMLSERGPNGMRVIGETEIPVADEDIAGVVIAPFKPAEVRVRVVREDNADAPLTTGSVFLIPLDSGGRSGMHQTQNGVYILHDVRPGKYEIRFSSAQDCYLKSVESSGRTLDPKSIDIAEGASLDLLLTYSPNVASVTGDIEVPQDRSTSPVHVWMISPDSSSPYTRVRTIEMDQSFHFSIQHLRPAKYLLFAAEEDDSDLWNSADFVKLLEPDGTELEVHEKQQATVHLKLIPKDETDRIRRQLGI